MGYPTFTALEIVELNNRIKTHFDKFHNYVANLEKRAVEEKAMQPDTSIIDSTTPGRLAWEDFRSRNFRSGFYDQDAIKSIISFDVITQFLEERKEGNS